MYGHAAQGPDAVVAPNRDHWERAFSNVPARGGLLYRLASEWSHKRSHDRRLHDENPCTMKEVVGAENSGPCVSLQVEDPDGSGIKGVAFI